MGSDEIVNVLSSSHCSIISILYCNCLKKFLYTFVNPGAYFARTWNGIGRDQPEWIPSVNVLLPVCCKQTGYNFNSVVIF